MTRVIKVTTPFTEDKAKDLKVGDKVLISGTIYTARDAAHKRLVELIHRDEDLPFEVGDSIVYYVGPSPAKGDRPIGSAGPTTSYRMDPYAPELLELGLRGMIGKGLRNEEVITSMIKNKAVYFGAIGGAAALISKAIIKAEIIAYEDLGSEAIRRLEVKDFPAIVVIDTEGNNLYQIGREQYINSMHDA